MLWLALSFVLGQTPQAAPRDVPQRPQTGTGTIRGRVTAADTGLPLHRAFVLLLNPDTSPEIFEALVKEATTVVVGEDDKRTLDLRVARGPQDR
jgi:hypothetical protein